MGDGQEEAEATGPPWRHLWWDRSLEEGGKREGVFILWAPTSHVAGQPLAVWGLPLLECRYLEPKNWDLKKIGVLLVPSWDARSTWCVCSTRRGPVTTWGSAPQSCLWNWWALKARPDCGLTNCPRFPRVQDSVLKPECPRQIRTSWSPYGQGRRQEADCAEPGGHKRPCAGAAQDGRPGGWVSGPFPETGAC